MPSFSTTTHQVVASTTCTPIGGGASSCVYGYVTKVSTTTTAQSDVLVTSDVSLVLGFSIFLSLFVVYLLVYVFKS